MDTETQFVIRNFSDEVLDRATNIVSANRRSREFPHPAKVYKQTPQGDVLMSYTGPRNRDIE